MPQKQRFALALTVVGLLSAFSTVGIGAETRRLEKDKYRFILCNDGGTLGAPDLEAPIGVAGLVRETIDPLRDTMINTLYWQIGTDPYFGTGTHRLSDWYSHNTKVGPIWGRGRTSFKTAGEWRIYQNGQQLMDQGTDSAAVVIEHGHKAGLDVFLSLRINDGHDGLLPGGLNDPNMAPQRHAHPDWLLGVSPEMMDGVTARLSEHTKFAYNFAVPEVRQYILTLVKEAIANYDLDGFDLDFCRQPSLFKNGEAARGAPLVTELLRQIRGALEVKGRASGKTLLLSVRVPPSLVATKKVGLEVATWIKERIVDIVVVGEPGGWHYRLPIEEYLALAQGTDCKIIAQDLCAFREDRGRSATVLFGEPNYYTTEQFRAVAARHWQAGAQGQYIWNQHFLKFSADDKFDRQHWKEIGTPEALEHLDKHYLVGPVGRGGSLPIELAVAGSKTEINVEIADEVRARTDAWKAHATLRLEVEQLTSLDQLDIRLNGTKLDPTKARIRLNYNDCWLDFDVTSSLKKGPNACSIVVEKRNPHVAAPLTVKSVEALIKFH